MKLTLQSKMRYRMLVIISTPRKGANISLLAAILSLTGTPALSLLFLSPLQCIHHHSTWPTLPWPLQPSPGLTWATCRLIAERSQSLGSAGASATTAGPFWATPALPVPPGPLPLRPASWTLRKGLHQAAQGL